MASDKHAHIPESNRERRIRKADKVYNTPIIPATCRILFWCMIALTAIAAALEVITCLRFVSYLGTFDFLLRVNMTALVVWSFFAAFLVAISVAQLLRIRRGHVETRYKANLIGNYSSTRQVVANPQEKYRRYIGVAAAGIALLGGLYLVFGFLK
jgi:hypothetical protein